MIKTILPIEILEASQGMILTNGQTYSKKVFLSVIDIADNWWEITEQEYEKILEAEKEQQNLTE